METELKLVLASPEAELAVVACLGESGYTVEQLEPVRNVDTYLDTFDWSLLKNKLALRFRISNGTGMYTLKSIEPIVDGIAKRMETEILLWTVAHLGDRTRGTLTSGPDHLTLRVPFVKRIGGVLVVNCGSAGHPVDGDPRPAYALVHAEPGAAPRGRIVRFEYDRNRTISALRKTSLPEDLRKDSTAGNKMRFPA